MDINQEFLERIAGTARSAAGLMVRNGFEIKQKHGYANIVTSSDVNVQEFLVAKLGELLPGSGFLCEEEGVSDISHEYVWVIDPIDGTANYARGLADCCVSIALVHNGNVCAGVVYIPWKDEMYCAASGLGASFNGKPVRVSQRPFSDGMLCTAMSTYRKEYAKTCSDIIYDVFMRCNDFRRFGSAAVELCMLAAGQIDLYFEMRLQAWDFTGAGFILQEAGGCICGFDGKTPDPFKQGLILAANNRENLQELLSTVHKYMDKLPY